MVIKIICVYLPYTCTCLSRLGYPVVERELVRWFASVRLCQDVNDSDLQHRALHIARALGFSQFRASRQWLYSWKVRNGLADPESERLEMERKSEESARLQEVAIALAAVRPTRAGMEAMTQLLRGDDRDETPQTCVGAVQRMVTLLQLVMAGLFGLHGAVLHLLQGLMSLMAGLMNSGPVSMVACDAMRDSQDMAHQDVKYFMPLGDERLAMEETLDDSVDKLIAEDLMDRDFFGLLRRSGRSPGSNSRLLETRL